MAVDPGAARTNVVFILTDDQGQWAASCYGNPDSHNGANKRCAQ